MSEVFEVGRTYSCRSAVSSSTVFTWQVIGRTAKTVRLQELFQGEPTGAPKTRRVKHYTASGEWTLPDGDYSMCPVIRADRPNPDDLVAPCATLTVSDQDEEEPVTNPYATAVLTVEQRQQLTNERDSFVSTVQSQRALLRRYLDDGVTDLGILHRTVEAMAEAQASVDGYDAGLAVLDAGHDPATTLADLVDAVTSPAKFSGVLGTAQAGVQTQVLRRFVTRLTRWGYFGKEE